MRFIVFGAGAVGGVLAARLHLAGHRVVAIARGAHFAAWRRDGLTLVDHTGTTRVPVPVADGPDAVEWSADDVVLVTVKSQDTAAALDALRAAAGSEVPVLCAQNGVANEREAARRFARVYGVMVWMPASHLEPGAVISHAAPVDGTLDIGPWPRGEDALAEEVARRLSASGVPAASSDDIRRTKHGKLLGNLGNAVQALCGGGEAAAELAREVRDEGRRILEAAGIAWASVDELTARYSEWVTRSDLPDRPRRGGSTWQSLARATGHAESDYLNGEITALAIEHGLGAPLNRALTGLAAQAARERWEPGSVDPRRIRAAAAAT